MYTPASFAETNQAKLHDLMRRNSFALLASQSPGGLVASHLPLLLDAEAGPRGTLFGHMARANTQWREAQGPVMAVFSGPHAYISPTWYAETGMVPTWNYVAVHAYGILTPVEGRDDLLDILRRSVDVYEAGRQPPWLFDESGVNVDGLLKAIVGFRIELTRLEGKWKLGQNHPEPRRRRTAEALRSQPDADSIAIAALMEEGPG
ncbi:FMN-binding negative transcriptional regulator [Isosphaeraceae bacterium EP7]